MKFKEINPSPRTLMTPGPVEADPRVLRAMGAHILGQFDPEFTALMNETNHSQNHKNMSQLSDEEKTQELMSVHEKVKELTGVKMQLFRSPYGDYDDAVVLNARENGYYPIQWDVDSLDWKDYGVDSILNTVLNHKALGNGSIILCHNGAKYTADALDALLDGLKEKGYQVVPISQLIYKENYHMDVTGRQIPDAK